MHARQYDNRGNLNKNVLNLLLKCTIQKIDTIFSLKMHTMNLSNIKWSSLPSTELLTLQQILST